MEIHLIALKAEVDTIGAIVQASISALLLDIRHRKPIDRDNTTVPLSL
jgi:hypothetical protein